MDKDKAKAICNQAESLVSKISEAVDMAHEMLDEIHNCIPDSPSKVYIVTEIRQYEEPQREVLERQPSVFTTHKRAEDYIEFCARQQGLTFQDNGENWFLYSKNYKCAIIFEIHPTLLNLGVKLFQFLK